MKECLVLYHISNLINGNRYIGQTNSTKIRWKTHRYLLRKGIHSNKYLQAAWNKYGEKNFSFEVIQEFESNEALDKAEIEIIKNNENLYNLVEGGRGTNGHIHSEETKKLIGERSKIPVVGMCVKTEEIIEYDSAADAERDGFEDSCIRKCVLGSLSTRKDGTTFDSISHKGWVWMSKEEATIEMLKAKCKLAKRSKIRKERAVLGMDISTKKIEYFSSTADAGRSGFRAATVYRCCNNMVKLHRGFVWIYADASNSQSLLESKRLDVTSKVRTGPKSRERK